MWLASSTYGQLVGSEHSCTTAFPRLGFDLLSYPDRLFPPQIPADILNFALNHQLFHPAKGADFLALSAWMLLCHVFWTGLSIKPDDEQIGEGPQLYFLSSSPTVPRSPGFHYMGALATFKILVGPLPDT